MMKFKITVTVETGLHIGGTTKYEIAGLDNVVIKTKDGYPYIPGSSLKGKLRSLLEINLQGTGDVGKLKPDKNGEMGPCSCGKCKVCLAFGYTSEENGSMVGAVIFRDLYIKNKKETPSEHLEVKYENTIDRRCGKTKTGGLRQTERVVPGTEFEGVIVVNEARIELFNEKNKHEGIKYTVDDVEKLLKKGIKYLQDDYLGGNGTRGYGQVKVKLEKLDGSGQ